MRLSAFVKWANGLRGSLPSSLTASSAAKAGCPRNTDRWQAYWVDDGPVDVLLFYCAACAKREFGEKS